MKIFEITQEAADLDAEPKDNADVDLTPDPSTQFNRSKAETGIITVPNKIKDDPAAQAAPIVQKGLELPADHPWNYLHGKPHPNVDLPEVPRGKPASKFTTT